MDLKLKLILLVVSVVQHLDASSTAPATTKTTKPITKSTSGATSGGASVTSGSSSSTGKPATKAPVVCYKGQCTGPDACTNATVIATYTTPTCSSGYCVTKILNITQYEFYCAATNCPDETAKAKANGWEVRCCEQEKCNKYAPAEENSSTRLRGDVIVISAWLVLFLLKLF